MAAPVIWTANDIGVLGPSGLRRMTMCLELKVPNLPTRTRLWREMGAAEGVMLQDADAARLARLVPAAPAVASAALRATRLAGGGAETARLIVEGVARAVAGGSLPTPEPEQGRRLRSRAGQRGLRPRRTAGAAGAAGCGPRRVASCAAAPTARARRCRSRSRSPAPPCVPAADG
jgi:hypothetical protein